jgi:protein tyrosine phosphatase (PTP) superfamily phosphohydrolase (DUF442 family)
MKNLWIVLPMTILVACNAGQPKADADPEAKAEAKTGTPKMEVTYAAEGHPEGLPRFVRWSDKSFQGAQPEGDAAFKNLAAMGVTTVISVDGAVPDIETATKYGLTYVHAPIGYDGVPREKALVMIEAARRSEGPVYVHCHHGKHRGPAGMMVIRLTIENISNEEAVEALKTSGTSPKYEGLYKDIGAFVAPTADELKGIATSKLPAKVLPEGTRATMVEVSHRWEFLKASRGEDWKPPADNPDVSPAHEARMLWELYRESARTEQTAAHGESFKKFLAEGEKAAIALEKALRAADHDLADQKYRTLKKNCNACHAEYRN